MLHIPVNVATATQENRMRVLFSVALALVIASTAFDVSHAQPSPGSKPDASAKTSQPARTPKSLECSKLADSKGLHGKERKRFRNKCRKG
jgi:hypothetical protein